MNKLKMLVGAMLAFALALAPVVPAHAEEESTPPAVGGSFGGLHPNLEFYGAKVLRLSNTTTASLLAGGELFLDAICAMRGTLGAYALAADSDIATSRTVDNSLAYAVSPNVYTAKDSTSAQHGNLGCWVPRFPIKLVNGLVGMNSVDDITSLFYVHSSSGVNPHTLGDQ
jgi:hypothetical protein